MTTLGKNSLFHDQPSIVAKKALAAFLQQPVDDISCKLVSGGSDEATIIKCTHLAASYIVKLFSSSEFGKSEIAWTQHASDLSVGPKLYYADPAGNYMLIEFAKGNSLVPAVANTPAIIKNIATSLAQLHHSAAPFAHVSDMFERINAKYKKLNCSGKLKDMLENGLQQVKEIEAQLQSLVVPLVPCHNDLNPGNIFSNTNQVILIDWGDAALSNPYYDIAAFFVLNVIKTENERLFLEQYDAQLLSPQWQIYMQLCKRLVYFEFALNLLLGVQAGKSESLYAQDLPVVNHISYYLTLLAERAVVTDSTFLYSMAIASLREMEFMTIIKLSLDQWRSFRDIRLEALQTDPKAFGGGYEEEALKSESEWRDWMQNMWFASVNEQIVGMIGLLHEKEPIKKNVARVISFWVKPSFRGQGIGKKLVQALQEYAAANGLEQLNLYVSPSQDAAIKLYESMTFKHNPHIADKENPDWHFMEWDVTLIKSKRS